MLLEITQYATRVQSPLELKISVLVLLLVFFLSYALYPSWLASNTTLSTLPIQRFSWKSEPLLSSRYNRIVSFLTSALAFSIFIYAHFFYGSEPNNTLVFNGRSFSFWEVCVLLLALFLLKLLSLRFFYFMHSAMDTGARLLDFQYAFNQLIAILLTAFLAVDVFFLRLQFDFEWVVLIAILALYAARFAGTIILMINHFNYPFIVLFIYLCAFEIAPTLILTKVLLLNS